ncbi:MAG: helix-turn-helix domain-containing protein [Caulobacteraceae bacterium]|nr:helix-turn-helix domain-containing protein [Caulobacteraceae bacterium]
MDGRSFEEEADTSSGAKIRAFQRERSVSQERMAKAIGLMFQQLQRPGGGGRLSTSKLFEIARALDVPLSSFVEGATGPDLSIGDIGG